MSTAAIEDAMAYTCAREDFLRQREGTDASRIALRRLSTAAARAAQSAITTVDREYYYRNHVEATQQIAAMRKIVR